MKISLLITLIVLGAIFVISVIGLIVSTMKLKEISKMRRNLFDIPLWESFLEHWEDFKFSKVVEYENAKDRTYYFSYGKSRYFAFINIKDRDKAPHAAIFYITEREREGENPCILPTFNSKMSKELARRLLFRHLYHKDVNTGEIKFEDYEN